MIYRRPPDIVSGSSNGIEEIEPIILDINQLLQSGNPKGNITLVSSDMICLMNEKDFEESFIRGQQVYITGQIKKPGAYKYRNDLTVLNLCLIAEGFTPIAQPLTGQR